MARSKEQIDQLKSLVDQLRSEGLSTDEIQAKVDEQKAKFDAEQTTTVEVTDEIQTTPTEGKTNGAVAKGATATPVTGQAPESTELELVDTSLDLQPKKVGRPDAKTRAANRAKVVQEEQIETQQPIEPTINYEELIDTPDYLDLFQDLSTDTGATKFTKKEAEEGGIKNWLKKYYYLFTEKYDLGGNLGRIDREKGSDDVVDLYYTQAVQEGDLSLQEASDLSKKLRIELAKLVTPRDLEKSKKRGLSLDQKENYLSQARKNLFNTGYEELTNKASEDINDYDFKINNLKKDADIYQKRINMLAPEMPDGKRYIVSEAQSKTINSLQDKLKDAQTQANDLIKQRNASVANIQNDLNDLSVLYGLDLATGVMKNNFQKTQDIIDYQNSIAGINPTEIYGGEVVEEVVLPNGEKGFATTVYEPAKRSVRVAAETQQAVTDIISGAYKFMKKGFTAPAYVMAGVQDMFTDEDTYSDLDAFRDALEEFSDFAPTPEGVEGKILDEEGNFESIRQKPQEYIRMASGMVPFTLAMISAGRKGNVKAAKDVFGKGFIKSSPKLRQDIAMADMAFRITVMDNTKEGEELGLNSMQAQAYGASKSLATGIAQSIFPDVNFLKSKAGKELLKQFSGNLKNAANKQAISGATKTFMGNVFKEFGEEEVEFGFDLLNKLSYGLALPDTQEISRQQKELVAGTLMLSGPLSSVGATKTGQAIKNQVYTGMKVASNDLLNQIKVGKQKAIELGNPEIAKQMEQAEIFTRNIVRAIAVSPENVTAEQLDLVAEKQNLLEQKKKLDPSFASEIDSQIAAIDAEIETSRVQQGRAETQRKLDIGTTKLADQLGIVSETVADDDAKLNRLNELKKEGYTVDEKDSTNYGTILTNDKGDTTIVFNEQANKEDNVITTGAHEMLHAVLLKTVSQNPGVAENLGTSLIDALKTINIEQVTDEYKNRLNNYLSDIDLTNDEAFEEGLTLLSEAMINGDIVYKESLAQKIGNGLEKLFGLAGGRAIFNDGKDVFKFIKDYNNSLIKGKVSQRVLKTAKEGALGTLTQVDTAAEAKAQPKKAASIRSPRGQEFIGLAQEGILTNENLVETIKSPSSTSEDKFGAIEAVVENNWPVISKAVKFNPTGTIPMEAVKEAVTEQIQGIFPGRGTALFDSYNPETSQVNTFIGSTLGPRQAEILERAQAIGGTTQAVDISEARGIAAEEVATAETPVKPEAKAIDPFRIMPDVKETATTEVQKSIADKDIDVTTVTYKELKDAAPYQTVADFFNIPVSRIKNPKDNLRKSDDVANIQRWILKNEPTLKNLFTEANREVVEVKEGNRVIRKGGEPTAIPRNLLNKFYNKGARVGNNFQWTLKPYDRTTFLEAVGIKDGKVDPNFTPRAAEAQTIKGILDMYTRNLGNLIARETIEAREDIAPAEKARVKAEVAKGKPRRMASKRIPLENRNSFIFSDSSDYDFASNARDWRKILNSLGIEQIDMSTEKGRQKFLNTAIETGLTEEIPESVWLTLGGTSERFVDEAQGIYYDPDLKAAVTKEGFEIRTDIGVGLRDYKRGLPFRTKAEAEAWIADSKKAGVKFAPETEASKAMAEKFGYNKKNDLSKKLNDPDFIAQQDLSLQGLKDLFNTFEKYINKGDNKNEKAAIVAVMLGSTSAHQGHFMRVAAPVRFYQEGYLDGPKGKTMVEEHTLPATILAKYLFLESYDGKVNKVWPNVERNYFQGALLKESDLKLKGRSDVNEKAFNYTEKTPEGWQMSDNIWARYFNLDVASNRFGIDPNTIKLTGGKSIFDIYNVDATGSRISDAGNLSRRRASRRNNSTIPKGSRAKNPDSMPDVLDRMSNLDEQAKEANKQLFDSADLNKGFNDILEQTTGIASEKRYKRVKAEVAGAARGRVFRGIPYSAQDLVGLLYETLGKGKLGDAQMAWWTENLLKPYAKAMNEIDAARLALMNDYKVLKKQLKVVPKDLRKKIPGEPFTKEQAVRVYIWNTQGMEVPGISETDLKDLTDFVENNEELKTFADQLIYIQKGDQYAKPKEGWPAGSITTDLLESINTVKRAKYLEQWKANKDVIFSEENMNKLEAAYGKKYRVALENMLERMQSGRNRRFSDDSLTGRFTDWLQGSIGTIMFFNTRSALLQTISSINFVNFTDNNPLAAAKAFANQKQYWSDFSKLINSDFLKARRSGLRMNVNEADIADMAKKGGPRAVINKLLQLGFAPTQIADSFAIASGGATFYRNRINTYKKQGLSQQEAETKAFEDFRENAEESQQSARPDRISMQQAGPLGRLILAFQNTPSQYARIIDKSVRDLKNGRGDAKTNISKIIYYSTVQNLLFNALQQALFAFAFGDEEPEDKEKEKKYVDIANSMMDSLLRGTGIAGGILSVGKNAILRIVRESEKDRPKYEKVGADLIKIAPPVSSKLSKINQAARSYEWDKEEMKQKGWSLDNPAYLAGANVISALTNVPLDRGIKKANNVVNATDSDLETWERLALLGGWQDWEIGVNEETKTNKPQPRKTKPRSRKTKTRKTTTR